MPGIKQLGPHPPITIIIYFSSDTLEPSSILGLFLVRKEGTSESRPFFLGTLGDGLDLNETRDDLCRL